MSSTLNTCRGKTTSNNLRTCETVIAGAFFFQPALEMPEKEMGQHTRQHVMVPAQVFADFIMVHAEFRLGFLKTLFNSPPDPAEPHKETQWSTHRRVAEVVPVLRIRPQCPLDEQPHGGGGLPIFAQHDPFAGELVRDGAFGPL